MYTQKGMRDCIQCKKIDEEFVESIRTNANKLAIRRGLNRMGLNCLIHKIKKCVPPCN